MFGQKIGHKEKKQKASKKINLIFQDHLYQLRGFMNKFINNCEFMEELFDDVDRQNGQEKSGRQYLRRARYA